MIFNRFEHLCRGEENRAGTQREKNFANIAGILDHIFLPAHYRAQPERVGYEENLQFGLDLEQAFELFHRLTSLLAMPVPVAEMLGCWWLTNAAFVKDFDGLCVS